MPRVFIGEERKNTEQQKKLYFMPGAMPTVIEELKKEISENFGKLKFQLPAVNLEFLIANLLLDSKKTKLNLIEKFWLN